MNAILEKEIKMIDKTAANERFCVIAAVPPQTMQCKLASYHPAASSVEAATTQSRNNVASNAGKCPVLKNCFFEGLMKSKYANFAT
jgi:hypothetical protein